jgi:hypothetical protein
LKAALGRASVEAEAAKRQASIAKAKLTALKLTNELSGCDEGDSNCTRTAGRTVQAAISKAASKESTTRAAENLSGAEPGGFGRGRAPAAEEAAYAKRASTAARYSDGGRVIVGSGLPYICGGLTAWSKWQLNGIWGELFVDVNTSNCAFGSKFSDDDGGGGGGGGKSGAKGNNNGKKDNMSGNKGNKSGKNAPKIGPVYLTSLLGGGAYLERGTLSLSLRLGENPSWGGDFDPLRKEGFRALLQHPILTGEVLLKAARDDKWQVSWMGATGRNTGTTVLGKTRWTTRSAQTPSGPTGWDSGREAGATSSTIVAEVNTTGNQFGDDGDMLGDAKKFSWHCRKNADGEVDENEAADEDPTRSMAPLYFASVQIPGREWSVIGGHMLRKPRTQSFEIETHVRRCSPSPAEEKAMALEAVKAAGVKAAREKAAREKAARATPAPTVLSLMAEISQAATRGKAQEAAKEAGAALLARDSHRRRILTSAELILPMPQLSGDAMPHWSDGTGRRRLVDSSAAYVTPADQLPPGFIAAAPEGSNGNTDGSTDGSTGGSTDGKPSRAAPTPRPLPPAFVAAAPSPPDVVVRDPHWPLPPRFVAAAPSPQHHESAATAAYGGSETYGPSEAIRIAKAPMGRAYYGSRGGCSQQPMTGTEAAQVLTVSWVGVAVADVRWWRQSTWDVGCTSGTWEQGSGRSQRGIFVDVGVTGAGADTSGDTYPALKSGSTGFMHPLVSSVSAETTQFSLSTPLASAVVILGASDIFLPPGAARNGDWRDPYGVTSGSFRMYLRSQRTSKGSAGQSSDDQHTSGGGQDHGDRQSGSGYFAPKLIAKFAEEYRWRAGYIRYTGPVQRDCVMGPWGRYSACPRSCTPTLEGLKRRRRRNRAQSTAAAAARTNAAGASAAGTPAVAASGTQSRTRSVVVAAANGGMPCPASTQSKGGCHAQPCPIDCSFGDWSEWRPPSSECEAQGGAAGITDTMGACAISNQGRRMAAEPPLYGGKSCPFVIETFPLSFKSWFSVDDLQGEDTQTIYTLIQYTHSYPIPCKVRMGYGPSAPTM